MTLVDIEAFDNEKTNSLLKAELERKQTSRRDVLRGLSAGAVVALGGAVAAGCGSSKNHNIITPPGTNNGARKGVARDIDILNFALNLEYLEAEFYSYAYDGTGIEAHNIVTTGQNGLGVTVAPGTTTGGVKVSLDNPTLAEVVRQLAIDERVHITDLRNAIGTLGGVAVAKPNINLAALAPAIDISTVEGFLKASRAFEDTGVSAYGGAAQYIYNSDILRSSARILAVEAYHASNIRLQIIQRGITSPQTDASDKPPTTSQYFTVEPINALSLIRTPREVLNIVLGSATATTGGFFPTGANANLATLTSLA